MDEKLDGCTDGGKGVVMIDGGIEAMASCEGDGPFLAFIPSVFPFILRSQIKRASVRPRT